MTQPGYRVEIANTLVGSVLAEIAVRIWEAPQSPYSVICAHGFAGNGAEFDLLGRSLAERGITVIAPDFLGRGRSTFLMNNRSYSAATYVACLEAVEQFATPISCHLGSTWGGVIQYAYLAGKAWKSAGLILNDVPLKSDGYLQGLRDYFRKEAFLTFATQEECKAYLIAARRYQFLAPDDLERILADRVMETEGGWRLAYDPAITSPFSNSSVYSLYDTLEDVSIPILMTYGHQSPHSHHPEIEELASKRDNVHLLTNLNDAFPVSLMRPEQIDVIYDFARHCFSQQKRPKLP